MNKKQIRRLSASILWLALLSTGTLSCEDTSIWDTKSMVGLLEVECTHDPECDDKKPCTIDTCTPQGQCTNALDTDLELPTNNPCKVRTCTTGEPSVALKDLPNGEPCERNDTPTRISICHNVECKVVHGEYCETAGECVSGYCYHQGNDSTKPGICQVYVGYLCPDDPKDCFTDYCDGDAQCAYLPLHAPCAFGDQCDPATMLCYPSPQPDVCKKKEGMLCVSNGECATNYCQFINNKKTCEKAKPGVACSYPDQCISGICFMGSCL